MFKFKKGLLKKGNLYTIITCFRSDFSDESLSPGKFTRQTEETDHDYTEDGYDASNMEQFHVEYVKHVEEPKEGEHCVVTIIQLSKVS